MDLAENMEEMAHLASVQQQHKEQRFSANNGGRMRNSQEQSLLGGDETRDGDVAVDMTIISPKAED